ncbi:phosphoribosylformylglycinamidine cyclo-ligase [Oribacterium sinus]|uniref:phosphoribosylformylglycinamidine cyclo-ligase n=1 Tax=Oribacterium sinus TaxID=237576 RepID=UPI0028D6B323|nr:phosphoribosylformylglycinamidine cyclo-ligase [Oribacterium sinus]
MALSYKEAGVDKEQGYKEVGLIKKFIKETYTPGVLSDLGGFSGLFSLEQEKLSCPVLVSGTDGVGTKVVLAQKLDRHKTIGIDCVAMCVNDILCQGAKPLFFLDYIACGKLHAEKMAGIVEGVAEGCKRAGAALIGGETAEMPGVYREEDYDLAGFAVGIVDREKIIDGKQKVKEGDLILALPSSGIHSNGFSLVRKIIFDKMHFDLEKEQISGKSLADILLEPTRIYVREVLPVLNTVDVHAMAHITGGGLPENLPRVLPDGLSVLIDESALPCLPIFSQLQEWGELSREARFGTFNLGVGFTLFVRKEDEKKVLSMLPESRRIGEVVSGKGEVTIQ